MTGLVRNECFNCFGQMNECKVILQIKNFVIVGVFINEDLSQSDM